MGKELICLDTSILIDFYRKKEKSNTKFVQLANSFDFAISVITKFEIIVGANIDQRNFWDQIFNHILIIPILEKEIEISAEIYRELKKRNKIIGLKDIFIASTAISNDLKISTLNLKDFERIENLKILY